MTGTIGPADIGALSPTEYLIMDVLAARARLGETCWTFPSRLRPVIESLARCGLLWWKPGIVERTVLAFLTDAGRTAVLSDTYTTPAEAERHRIAGELDALAARQEHDTSLGFDEYQLSALTWAVRDAAQRVRDDKWGPAS